MPPNIDTCNVWSDSRRKRERERMCERKRICVYACEERLIGRTCEEEMEEYECVGWHIRKKAGEKEIGRKSKTRYSMFQQKKSVKR